MYETDTRKSMRFRQGYPYPYPYFPLPNPQPLYSLTTNNISY